MQDRVMIFAPLSYCRENAWPLQNSLYTSTPIEAEGAIWLLTPRELLNLDPDAVVTSIFGEAKRVGDAALDLDTRGGYTAYGLFKEQFLDQTDD